NHVCAASQPHPEVRVTTSTTLRPSSTYSPTIGGFTPAAAEERIVALDVVRGFTMFGVLWSNLNDWYGPWDTVTALDRALWWTQRWIIESRFVSVLAIMFGIGFTLQLRRAEERGTDPRPTFYRRTLALLAFGLLHTTLLFHADILTMYALSAFALALFRTA